MDEMLNETGTIGSTGIKRRSPPADFFLKLVRQKRLGTLGAVIVLVFLLSGIFADFLAPYDKFKQSLRYRLKAPSPFQPWPRLPRYQPLLPTPSLFE